jgi:excisionase family DNA binding protein
MGPHPAVFTTMGNLKTNPKKMAVRVHAAISNNAQPRPTDLVLAKTIVDLSEKCHYQPVQNLMRSGFSFECAFSINLAYMYAVNTRIGPKWVGAARAARLIGVSPSRVQAMARAGELRTLMVGKSYRFHEKDLLDWMVAQPLNPPDIKLGAPTDPERPRKPKRDA